MNGLFHAETSPIHLRYQAGRDVERGKAGSEDGQKPTGAALALSVNVACLNEKQDSGKLGLVRSFLK